MAKRPITFFKYTDLKNSKFKRELKAMIKRLKDEAQYEEDRKYYCTLVVTK